MPRPNAELRSNLPEALAGKKYVSLQLHISTDTCENIPCKIVVQHDYSWVICFKKTCALDSTGRVSYLSHGCDQTSEEQLLRAGKVYFCSKFEGQSATVERSRWELEADTHIWVHLVWPGSLLFIFSSSPTDGSCHLVQGGCGCPSLH